LDLGKVLTKALQDERQAITTQRLRGTEHQCPGWLLPSWDRQMGFLREPDHMVGIVEQAVPRLGEDKTFSKAIKELDTKFVFQRVNVVGNAGLGIV
jgi:hypothetical protein